MGFFDNLLGWSPERNFKRHLPVISQAIHDYELGTYWRLSKVYEKRFQGDFGYSLAYTVVYYLFLNEEGMKSMESFYKTNKRLVDEEIQKAVKDEQIRTAFSMACAAKCMTYGYVTRNPFGENVVKAPCLGLNFMKIQKQHKKMTHDTGSHAY